MSENPYEPPKEEEGEPGYHLRLDVTGALLCISTLLGIPVGAMGGITILLAMPRYLQPTCGNTVIDPAVMVGAGAGLLVGLGLVFHSLFANPGT